MDLIAKDSPTEHGAVASLLVVALIDALLDDNTLSREKVIALLRTARRRASPYAATGNGRGAIRIIDELIIGYAEKNASQS